MTSKTKRRNDVVTSSVLFTELSVVVEAVICNCVLQFVIVERLRKRILPE